MRIRNVRQYFQDTLVELVGIRSGLAVSVPKAIDLLNKNGDEADRWWDGNAVEILSIRAETFQRALAQLLFNVGLTPDARSAEEIISDFGFKNLALLPDDSALKGVLPIEARKLNAFGQDVVDAVTNGKSLPEELASLPQIGSLLRQVSIRHIWGESFPESHQWNGTIPLNDLFASEDAPSDPNTYFEQRYIDYLAAQPKEISDINWRKFEQLTGEYFSRNGYKVELGAGRKDGGIDVVAQKASAISGPELVIVQCRRYNEESPVGVDAVRAFWATVNDESATKGVIATTSRLTKGARDYCDARKYRLSGADRANVLTWLQQMRSTETAPGT